MFRIFCYQLSLPKAEQLLAEAGIKMAEAKQSVVQAKEVILECPINEWSGKSVASSSSVIKAERPIEFDPTLASTPQNSPKGIDLTHSLFDDAFRDELSISLTEVQGSSLLSQGKGDTDDESSYGEFKVNKDGTPLPVKTPRPKRHCTELTTSYAEDDLAK